MTEPHLNFETILYPPEELSEHDKRLMSEYVTVIAGVFGVGIIVGLITRLIVWFKNL